MPESFIYDYLKNHDFGEPVSVDDLKALMDFEWIVDNPQYKFNNMGHRTKRILRIERKEYQTY